MGSGWHLCQRGLHPEEAHAPGRATWHCGQGCAQVRLADIWSRQPQLVRRASLLEIWWSKKSAI